MQYDLTTKASRIGWYQSILVRKDKGDKLITILAVIGVVSLMVANLIWYAKFK